MDTRVQVKVLTTISIVSKDHCHGECRFYSSLPETSLRWCVLFLTPLKHKGRVTERCAACREL